MNAGDRIEITCTLVGEYQYQRQFGWQTQWVSIYKMKDSEGRIFVWKTTSALGIDRQDKNGCWYFEGANKRDTVRIKATIKGFGEYKGEEQIELQRVKVQQIDHAPSEEQIREDIRKRQLESMQDGDILLRMRYSARQEHYADCEVLKGSFDEMDGTIQVIVRKGRLKASGVRGKHFLRYCFVPAADAGKSFNELSDYAIYSAVDKEHAFAHLLKDHPECTDWELWTIYRN